MHNPQKNCNNLIKVYGTFEREVIKQKKILCEKVKGGTKGLVKEFFSFCNSH